MFLLFLWVLWVLKCFQWVLGWVLWVLHVCHCFSILLPHNSNLFSVKKNLSTSALLQTQQKTRFLQLFAPRRPKWAPRRSKWTQDVPSEPHNSNDSNQTLAFLKRRTKAAQCMWLQSKWHGKFTKHNYTVRLMEQILPVRTGMRT